MEVPREADSGDQQQRKDLYSVLDKAAAYFQEQLRSHPRSDMARDYLQKRGLVGQVAKRFGIGFAPPGWDNLLKFLGSDEDGRRLLSEAGLIIEKPEENKCYDRFRERIIFPIRDVRGRVIAFGGRVIDQGEPKYLNSPETKVFQKGRELYGLYEANSASRHLEKILVVEGYMDVVALAQHGIEFAAATLGTAAGQMHLEKAFRFTSEVIFCFDGDEAGRRAARRALESSLPVVGEGRQVRFMFLPEGEDPDTMVRSEGAEAFSRRVQESRPLSEYLFDCHGDGLDLATAEGRSQLVSRVIPALKLMPAGVFREQLRNLLVSRSQSDPATINDLLESGVVVPETAEYEAYDQYQDADPVGETEPASRESRKSGLYRLSLAEELVSLLLHSPGWASHCESLKSATEFNVDPEVAMLTNLLELLEKYPDSSLNRILGLWRSIHGPDECEQLYQLAARELLIPLDQSEPHFLDVRDRLLQTIFHEKPLEELIEKARNGTISESEKKELNHRLLADV
jgi:DNA primase